MERITSRTNERIKLAASLKHSRFRVKEGLFLAEGERLVRDAVQSGIVLKWLFVTDSAISKSDLLVKSVDDSRVISVTDCVAQKLQDTKSSQGVFGVFEIPSLSFEPENNGKYIVLENLQNPSNLGAILRSAEAFGLDGAVLINCPDPFSPKALRGGMGCVFRLPVICTDSFEVIDRMKQKGIAVIGSVVRGATADLDQLHKHTGIALAVGNEGSGLSDGFLSLVTDSVTIEMRGRAESLNAASAAAVMMYEMMK